MKVSLIQTESNGSVHETLEKPMASLERNQLGRTSKKENQI